jgi:hypothetical protein
VPSAVYICGRFIGECECLLLTHAGRASAAKAAQAVGAADAQAAAPPGASIMRRCTMIRVLTGVCWTLLAIPADHCSCTAGEHENPLQVLTGFESSPFKNGGYLFEHHACGCAKFDIVQRSCMQSVASAPSCCITAMCCSTSTASCQQQNGRSGAYIVCPAACICMTPCACEPAAGTLSG